MDLVIQRWIGSVYLALVGLVVGACSSWSSTDWTVWIGRPHPETGSDFPELPVAACPARPHQIGTPELLPPIRCRQRRRTLSPGAAFMSYEWPLDLKPHTEAIRGVGARVAGPH